MATETDSRFQTSSPRSFFDAGAPMSALDVAVVRIMREIAKRFVAREGSAREGVSAFAAAMGIRPSRAKKFLYAAADSIKAVEFIAALRASRALEERAAAGLAVAEDLRSEIDALSAALSGGMDEVAQTAGGGAAPPPRRRTVIERAMVVGGRGSGLPGGTSVGAGRASRASRVIAPGAGW